MSYFVKLLPINFPTCLVPFVFQQGQSFPTPGKRGPGVHCKLLSGLFLMGL